MVTVDVRGVQIMFPFPPYECQLAYMDKVIEAIDMVSLLRLSSQLKQCSFYCRSLTLLLNLRLVLAKRCLCSVQR